MSITGIGMCIAQKKHFMHAPHTRHAHHTQLELYSHNCTRAETDCLKWAKTTLTTMLSDLTIFDDVAVGKCTTGTVSSVTGECTANIRKGKSIFYYELEVKVPWEGRCIAPI
jgi:hypothetical protein